MYVQDTETDDLGFVQNGEKQTNVLTGKTYSYNPYELQVPFFLENK